MVVYSIGLLLFSVLICPTPAEVLTQSFILRLNEMEQLIQDQKQVIQDQKEVIESLKSGKYNDKNHTFIHVIQQ